MNKERPLGRHIYFESSNVDEVCERVSKIYKPHKLDIESGGSLDAWQSIARLPRLAVSALCYGASVRVQPDPLEHFYLVEVPYRGYSVVEVGDNTVTTDQNTGVLINPTDLVRMRWSANCTKLMVRIEREKLEQQLSLMLGTTIRKPINFCVAMPLESRSATWWHFVRLLIANLEAPERYENHSATLSQIESLLLVSLLEAQPNNYSEALRSKGVRIAPHHVRQVEQYIDAHARESISLEQLVTISGTSGRALFDGFRRFRGTSPMAFLRTVRMRRAREDLLSAPNGVSVSTIAARWHFLEPGRFAVQYRQAYGETPSETLRSRKT